MSRGSIGPGLPTGWPRVTLLTTTAITLKKFKSGSTLFAFDLSPDEDDGGHWDLARDGAVYINMHFSVNVPAAGIELIAYAEFDNLVTVDRNRNPYTDYKA